MCSEPVKMPTEDFAISLRGISKKYRLFGSPKERFKEAFHPFGKQYHQEFWALKGVDLDVKRGETFGIVGRNGSGKSTLLQVVCGILKPTSGSVRTNGRISALLELGAGFNPHFTGRENVILNGGLHGSNRREMLRKLPEIIEFADIGEFVDQPVKTYSSGMFLRLAFAAAVHVDPEILVVDEALAVGDTAFQNRCYGKIRELKSRGITILLVTHDRNAVTTHCDRAMLLVNGKRLFVGDVLEALHQYSLSLQPVNARSSMPSTCFADAERFSGYSSSSSKDRSPLDRFLSTPMHAGDNCPNRIGYNKFEHIIKNGAQIIDYLLLGEDGFEKAEFKHGECIQIFVKFVLSDPVPRLFWGCTINSLQDHRIFSRNTDMWQEHVPFPAGKVGCFRATLQLVLNDGPYFISVGISKRLEDDKPTVPLTFRNNLIQLIILGSPKFFGNVSVPCEFYNMQDEIEL